MPRRNNSVLVRNKYPPLSTVMSISIKEDFICARSVGPFGPPKEEKGVQHMFFFFLENCSLGLHGICSMSATDQYQLIWQVIFHSVRSSALWRGVKTRPQWLILLQRTKCLWAQFSFPPKTSSGVDQAPNQRPVFPFKLYDPSSSRESPFVVVHSTSAPWLGVLLSLVSPLDSHFSYSRKSGNMT